MGDKREQLGRDARDPFLLGDFRVDPGALCMGRAGACERIEAKTMQVLLALAERPDQVVTREELAHQVWPGRIVTDDALTNAIGKLRRALDDDARSPRFVETIAKRGYRLKVAPRAGGAARPPPMTVFAGAQKQRIRLVGLLLLSAGIVLAALVYWSATRMPEIPAVARESAASVAVMPFEVLGGNPSHRYFAEGITLDVITELSRMPGLLVIAPGSAFGYRETSGRETSATDAEIAAELGVHYLIRGGVQRLGDRIRINVRLLAAARGETLWAERFAGDASSLFRIQDQRGYSIMPGDRIAPRPRSVKHIGATPAPRRRTARSRARSPSPRAPTIRPQRHSKRRWRATPPIPVRASGWRRRCPSSGTRRKLRGRLKSC